MKISLITVSFNSEKTIRSTIDSVLSQTYDAIEYIVCDGNSTDGTIDILKEYEGQITVVSEPDRGIYDAMNKGIKLASGDVIGIINSDDFYSNEHVIEKVVKTFQSSGSDSVYGDLQYIDPNNERRVVRYWKSGNFKKSKMLRGWMVPHPTFFIKKSVYEQYGLFDWHYRISGDYEMAIRLLYKNNVTAHYLPEVLVKMRAGGVSNSSIFGRVRANIEDHRAWKDNNLKRRYYTVPLKPIRKIGQFVYPKISAFM